MILMMINLLMRQFLPIFDYLVTNDRHFDILKYVDFPKITVCKADDFKMMLSEGGKT